MFSDLAYPCFVEIASPTPDQRARAVAYLDQGNLVALPTETVYGLAADATCDQAIAKIYQLKQRPTFNPLIVHFAALNPIRTQVEWHDQANQLAQAFWPGPLTLVLNKRPTSSLSLLATAGLETVGVRIPDHPVTRAVIEQLGKPLAAPSANPSEAISPTSTQDVRSGFGAETPLFILEGGPCVQGLESTILDVSDPSRPTLLRPGLITQDQLEHCLGGVLAFVNPHLSEKSLKSPGQMRRHYAPHLPVRLEASHVLASEVLLAFGPTPLQGAKKMLNLSEQGDLREAAAHLFSMMRTLDQPDACGLAVMPIPNHGIGMAINDRLQRASAKKV